jgi:hypothetical protein
MLMKKSGQNRVTNRDLLIHLLKANALTEASLSTLFMLHCELIAHLTKSNVGPIIENWSQVKMDFLQQNLDELRKEFGPESRFFSARAHALAMLVVCHSVPRVSKLIP